MTQIYKNIDNTAVFTGISPAASTKQGSLDFHGFPVFSCIFNALLFAALPPNQQTCHIKSIKTLH